MVLLTFMDFLFLTIYLLFIPDTAILKYVSCSYLY